MKRTCVATIDACLDYLDFAEIDPREIQAVRSLHAVEDDTGKEIRRFSVLISGNWIDLYGISEEEACDITRKWFNAKGLYSEWSDFSYPSDPITDSWSYHTLS